LKSPSPAGLPGTVAAADQRIESGAEPFKADIGPLTTKESEFPNG
jgi:hypothetical protein